jgi:ABC-type glycerol-3-phosphate transport system permease component
MLKIFLNIGTIVRLAAELLLIAFLVLLFLPALGLLGSKSPALAFQGLGVEPYLGTIIKGSIFSIIIASVSSFFGVLFGFLAHRNFVGRAFLFSLLGVFLIAPDSVHYMTSNTLSMFWVRGYNPITDYNTNLIWGFLITFLAANTFMQQIHDSQIESAKALGAKGPQIFTSMIFPRMKPLFITSTFLIAVFNMVQGFNSYNKITPLTYTDRIPKDLNMAWLLKGPFELFGISSLGAAAYLIILFLAFIAAYMTLRYVNSDASIDPEGMAAMTSKKSKRKRVTRKKAKKKKAKKVKKEKKAPEPEIKESAEPVADNEEEATNSPDESETDPFELDLEETAAPTDDDTPAEPSAEADDSSDIVESTDETDESKE